MANNAYSTYIGLLACHESADVNLHFHSIFNKIYKSEHRDTIDKYHFIFTGGTHDRIFYGHEELGVPPLDDKCADWLRNGPGVTRLGTSEEGGVIDLSYLICKRHCSILWPFFSASGAHWLRPENLALMRLCDQWHAKRLMNRGSVLCWFDREAEKDANRNLRPVPLDVFYYSDEDLQENETQRPLQLATEIIERKKAKNKQVCMPDKDRKKFKDMTVALIAHDEMKKRMIDFAIDHEAELNSFKRIIATGTTGREVAAATSRQIKNKLVRCHSGPHGGDIEIAKAILYGLCDLVIFFIDPLRPHPHVEDIRVVFEACMIRDHVVMISNEMHAREFMSVVVRGNDSLGIYKES